MEIITNPVFLKNKYILATSTQSWKLGFQVQTKTCTTILHWKLQFLQVLYDGRAGARRRGLGICNGGFDHIILPMKTVHHKMTNYEKHFTFCIYWDFQREIFCIINGYYLKQSQYCVIFMMTLYQHLLLLSFLGPFDVKYISLLDTQRNLLFRFLLLGK